MPSNGPNVFTWTVSAQETNRSSSLTSYILKKKNAKNMIKSKMGGSAFVFFNVADARYGYKSADVPEQLPVSTVTEK